MQNTSDPPGDELAYAPMPHRAARKLVGEQGFCFHFNAEAGHRGCNIATPLDSNGVDEMFVKVFNVLDHAILHRAAHGYEIKHRQMLNLLTQSYAARMGANGYIEFPGEQQDGKIFVDACNTTGVNLADIDGAQLHELLDRKSVV